MLHGRDIAKQGSFLRIGSNVPSMIAQRRMDETRQIQEREGQRLASGDRILRAAYDPSGLAISETMRSRSRSLQQANRNTVDGVSLIQVAEGSLATIQDMSVRLRELAMQSATDTYNDDQRSFIQREFQGLVGEVERILAITEYNGTRILDGSTKNYDLQIGIHGDANSSRLSYDLKKILENFSNLSVNGTSVSSKFSAQNSLGKLDSFIQQVSHGRAFLGSFQNRLLTASANLQTMDENTQAANSKIRDTDVAQAAAERAKAQINGEAAIMMLKKTTLVPQNVQKLLD